MYTKRKPTGRRQFSTGYGSITQHTFVRPGAHSFKATYNSKKYREYSMARIDLFWQFSRLLNAHLYRGAKRISVTGAAIEYLRKS
jgi:hypothetical protein